MALRIDHRPSFMAADELAGSISQMDALRAYRDSQAAAQRAPVSPMFGSDAREPRQMAQAPQEGPQGAETASSQAQDDGYQIVIAPNGDRVRFPVGTPDDEIVAVMGREYGQGRDAAAQSSAGEDDRSPLRGAGISSRGIVEGTIGAISGLGALPLDAAYNVYAGLSSGADMGMPFSEGVGRTARRAADAIGLPEPESAGERVINSAASGTAGAVAGGFGLGALARYLGRSVGSRALQEGGEFLAQQPAAQAVSGAAAGGSAQAAQDAGMSPAASTAIGMGAGVLAGVPAGMAGGAVSRATSSEARREASRAVAGHMVERDLAADGTSLRGAGNAMAEARNTLGQELGVVDTAGEAARTRLRSATNINRDARSRVVSSLEARNADQGSRIKDIVGRAFKYDEAGYERALDDLIERRRVAASPFYREAEANPVPFTNRLEELLSRPAGRAALARARTIAENEGLPFQQWFGRVDDAGNILEKNRVPDMRAWDYIKRGFDEAIQRDATEMSPFGAKFNSPSGRAINTLRRELLAELDKLNPAYKKARSVATDNISAYEALNFGLKAFGKNDRDVRRAMKGFSAGEKEAAKIGFARALRDNVEKAGMTHDAVKKIFNSEGQIATVKAILGDNVTEFANLRRAMENEVAMRKTSDAVRGNSTTVQQLLDAGNTYRMAQAVGFGIDIATGTPIAAGARVLRNSLSRMGGLTPQVADDVAAILMERDPQKVMALARQLEEIAKRRQPQSVTARAVRSAVSSALGVAAGEPPRQARQQDERNRLWLQLGGGR